MLFTPYNIISFPFILLQSLVGPGYPGPEEVKICFFKYPKYLPLCGNESFIEAD